MCYNRGGTGDSVYKSSLTLRKNKEILTLVPGTLFIKYLSSMTAIKKVRDYLSLIFKSTEDNTACYC